MSFEARSMRVKMYELNDIYESEDILIESHSCFDEFLWTCRESDRVMSCFNYDNYVTSIFFDVRIFLILTTIINY